LIQNMSFGPSFLMMTGCSEVIGCTVSQVAVFGTHQCL
jgi:hypothetical protein